MDALRAVRGKVFIEEQGISREEEWDGLDEDATHFLARLAGRPIGTARLLATGQIGRMAVLPEFRRTGVGRRLLDAAVDAASASGKTLVFLHAQRDVEAFYRANGFVTEGETFFEAGIAHVNMRRPVPITYVAPALPLEAGTKQLRATHHAAAVSTVQTLRGEVAFRDASAEAAAAAHRHLRIRSVLLDPLLYDTEAFAAIVSALARRHAQTLVRILISDASLIVNEGHRLLTLARRLPSKVLIRKPRETPNEGSAEEPAFLLADASAIVMQPKSGGYVGFVDLRGAALAHNRMLEFDAAWERAVEIPDLRLLGI